MSEEGNKTRAKLEAEAKKYHDRAAKLTEVGRKTPLELADIFWQVNERQLYKYMPGCTYTKAEEWAADLKHGRSTFFMNKTARELNRDMPLEQFLRFKSVSNALWYGKLPKKQQGETMFKKACEMDAEEFCEEVRARQAENGQQVDDKRVTMKIRMYGTQKEVLETMLKEFAIENDLDITDPGRVLELASVVVMQSLGKGKAEVVKLSDTLRLVLFELGQMNTILAGDKAADEQLKEVQALLRSMTEKIAAGNTRLPEPKKQSETKTAPKASAAAAGAGTEKKTLSSKELASMRVM